MNLTRMIAISLLSAAVAFPKEREKVQLPPTAPLPDRVLQARTVMVTSEADKLVYDEAYRRIQEWGRFQLNGDPERADLILIIRSGYGPRPPRWRDVLIPYPYPYPYPGWSYQEILSLIILDAKTKLELWSETQENWPAVKRKNREKNTILAVDALIRSLRERMAAK